MTDLVQKARLGRANALNHISGRAQNIFADRSTSNGRRSLPVAFVSSRAKLGGQATIV